MRAAAALATAVLAVGLGGCAAVQPTASQTPVIQSANAERGYLTEARLQALADAVPPAPTIGSAAALADISASERLRALENGDRWLLATRHAELRPALALAHFDCALGFRLSSEDAPRLVGILERVLHDANAAAEKAKARAFRPRPVAADPQRSACQVVSAAGRASASYPSGSATVGVAYSQVLAALAPEQAQAVHRIGHEIAVSRMVCGMHYPADVAAGEALGQAVFAETVADPTFQADIEAARPELARGRAAGLTSPACAAERAALAIPLP